MTAELIEKLNATLDETERLALAASGPVWIDEIGDVREAGNENWVANAGVRDRQHIVHNDPDSVLRQVAARRKILGWCVDVLTEEPKPIHEGRDMDEIMRDEAVDLAAAATATMLMGWLAEAAGIES